MKSINTLYSETLEKLKVSPVSLALSENQLKELRESISDNKNDLMIMRKHLFLIYHSRKLLNEFDSFLINCCNKALVEKEAELLILAISTLSRQTLARKKRDGEKISHEVIQLFRKMLKQEDPEILWWTLTTLEEIGGQIFSFKEDIQRLGQGFHLFSFEKRKVSNLAKELLKKMSPPKKILKS